MDRAVAATAARAIREASLEQLEPRLLLSTAPTLVEPSGLKFTAYEVHGRFGNNAMNGDWEVGLTDNTNQPPEDQDNYAWANGTAVPFTLAVTANHYATFTLGDVTVENDYSALTDMDLSAVFVWAKASKPGSGLTIGNLVLDGVAVPGTISVDNAGTVFSERWVVGGDMLDGFTLTGDVTMTWDTVNPANKPLHSNLQFHIQPGAIIDLDVDSDNNDDYLPPQRDTTEESIEASDTLPGKVIAVNDDDTDEDGVLDFADGFNWDESSEGGASGEDDLTIGEQFVPVVLQLPVVDPNMTVRILYSDSDPACVTRTGSGEEGDPWRYTAAPGYLRLWTSDGDQTRGSTPFNLVEAPDGLGHYVPATNGADECYGLSDLARLGITSGNSTVVLYAEAVAPATELADGRIEVQVDPDGPGPRAYETADAVYLSPWAVRLVEVGSDDSLTPVVDGIQDSHVSPTIAVTVCEVQNIRFNADKSAIIGDLHLVGTVDSAMADVTAGDMGRIETVSLYWDGLDDPIAEVPLVVTKTEDVSSILKSEDYTGQFDYVLPEMVLNEGYNLLKLLAVDKVTQLAGFSEWSVEAVVDTPDFVTQSAEMRVDLLEDLYPDVVNHIQAEVILNGMGAGLQVLTETAPDSLEFSNEDGTVTAQLAQPPVLDPDAPDIISVMGWNETAGVYAATGELVESGNDTKIFQGAGEFILEDWELTDYSHSTVQVADVIPLLASEGGDFHPYVLEVQGAPPFLQAAETITTEDGERPVVHQSDGKAYMGAKGTTTQPSRLAVLCSKPLQLVESGFLPPKDIPDFAKGVIIGFGKGGVSLVEGAWELIKISPGTVQIQLMIEGPSDFIKKRLEIHRKMTHVAETVGTVVGELAKFNWDIFNAVAFGTQEEIANVGEVLRTAMEYSAEVMIAICDTVINLTPQERGEICGQIIFEVVSLIATEGIGTALKAGKAATMIRVLNEIKPKFATAPKYIGCKVVEALDKAVEFFGRLQTSKMCFVAGTDVLTMNGAMDIETLRPGDMVLSRDEATGEQAYKPVLQTFVTHPSALYTVTYGDGDEIVCTGQHPFYVVDKGGFVEADDLVTGDTLSLADGGTVSVLTLSSIAAPVGRTFTTYNIEVADYHTYFAGEVGVWVHNAGVGICQKLFSVFDRHVTHLNATPEQAFAQVNTLMSKMVSKGKYAQDGAYVHLGDCLDEVVRKMRIAEGKTVPNGPLWSPGQAGNPSVNMWNEHWLKHKVEFPNLSGPVGYVDKALDYAHLTTSTQTVKVAEGMRGNQPIRMIWDQTTNTLSVANLDQTGAVESVSTMFQINANQPAHILAEPGATAFEKYWNFYLRVRKARLK